MKALKNKAISKQDILIITKTYPEISRKYTETVCTVGVLKNSKSLVRLYPIRYRYLDVDRKFKKYQWINVKIERSTSDSRPESYAPTLETMVAGDFIIPGKDWGERSQWVLSPSNVFGSLEHLMDESLKTGVSLGLFKPRKDVDIYIEYKSAEEINESIVKRDSIVKQRDMFEEIKEYDILPVRLKLKFKCEDNACRGHDISILDWEFAELYRKFAGSKECLEKLRQKIAQIFNDKNDTYLLMGNLKQHRNIFCILGFFYPSARRNLSLF